VSRDTCSVRKYQVHRVLISLLYALDTIAVQQQELDMLIVYSTADNCRDVAVFCYTYKTKLCPRSLFAEVTLTFDL